MPTSRQILESTYRLGRMKKVRWFILISHILLALVLLVIIAMFATNTGSYLLYLQLEIIVFILVLILLILNIESFFFKFFGIKWAKSDSEKFLMAKDYMKKALAITIIAAIVLAIMFVLAPMADENIDSTKSTIVYGTYNTTFEAQDPFGVTGVKVISVTSDDNVPLDVFILLEEDFEDMSIGKRVNFKSEDSRNVTDLRYETEDFLTPGKYVVVIDAKDQTVNVTYGFERSISEELVFYLTIYPILYIAANCGWMVYLFPIRKKYEKTSIYE